MRITPTARKATRRRILEFAGERFAALGFDAVTTRDVARAAGIATGTLFNYFATKEAIAAALLAEALDEAHARFDARRRRGDSLEEELFALVAAELRAPAAPELPWCGPRNRPRAGRGPTRRRRRGDAPRSPTDRGPAPRGRQSTGADRPRICAPLLDPLRRRAELLAQDPSPNQEDTLALLDQSLRAFVTILPPKAGGAGPARSRGAV